MIPHPLRAPAISAVALAVAALGGPPRAADSGAAPQPIALTLDDAVRRGLEHNLDLLARQARARAAHGARVASRGALLPDLEGDVVQSRESINLEAYGLPVAPGESPIVGPFDVFDARLSLEQSLFDLGAIRRYRAGVLGEEAATSSVANARETVAFLVSDLYLRALSAESRIEASESQVESARKLSERADDMHHAGTVPGIDPLRARVELETQRQRLIVARNDFEKQKLVLARAIGLPLAEPFTLADRVPYSPPPTTTTEDALSRALASRADFRAAGLRVDATANERRAATAGRLPSLHLHADWGAIGPATDTAKETFAVAATLGVPLWRGGRVSGRIVEADARLEQARLARDDLRDAIELEVRSVLLDLGAADRRVAVARDAERLAGEQLRQAEDRFATGVTSNLEVVQAQEAVATASENTIAALYAYNLARLSLLRATGTAERAPLELLEGSRP